ncbi:MAG TPA: LysR family transcriptional regulator, partial [Sulfolobales archaeon]|nr:LysR family transcriptional regulator [Sulfolobales archaeon]
MSSQSGIRVRYQVVIDIDGGELIDEQVINALRIVKERGSLLAASKSIGIPYSRLWERISKIEGFLGRKLLLHKRGGRRGGGSVLTEFGENILKIYDVAKTRLEEAGLARPLYIPTEGGEPVAVVSYSHDPVIELILKSLSTKGFKIRGVCSGSGLSLAM